MYLDSILRKYDMPPLPDSAQIKEWREELSQKSYDELKSILIAEKKKLHNTSEFGSSERILKAILLNRFRATDECKKIVCEYEKRPVVKPLVLGTTLERSRVREKIKNRLCQRLDAGLIEEVENLHKNGASWERLESLGLEYRFVSQFLKGEIESKEKLTELLGIAIGQFAKRQETWFRGMEKKGVKVHWLPKNESVDERLFAALELCRENVFCD